MTEVDLYNLSPTLRLLGMGVLIALLPLAWTLYRHRHNPVNSKLRAMTVLTLFLTFDLVLLDPLHGSPILAWDAQIGRDIMAVPVPLGL